MNIVHIHLLGPYTEGWGYQENILPKIQVRQGHTVSVITNCYKHSTDGTIIEIAPEERIIDGVKIIRLKRKNFIKNKGLSSYLFLFPVYEALIKLHPDVILLHGLGTGLANYQIKKYVKKHDVLLYGDSHVIREYIDTSNKNIADIIKHAYSIHCKKILYPFYKKIFGITPECVEFATTYYRTPEEKMELFPLGYDPEICKIDDKSAIRRAFRKEHKISDDTLVLAHGGKIIPRRNTELAIKAFLSLKNTNSKMIIFGDIAPEVEDGIMKLINSSDRIIYLGHLSQKDYVKVFMASDIGFFPGAQSALWQEAIGCGLPLILGEAPAIDYLDRGGNMIMVSRSDVNDSVNKIEALLNENKLTHMKKIAESSAREFFSYERISNMMLGE